jgi:hypothetical protein|tara:strand:- start:45 stop:359 length:315 start_codon:yes stop_codon:yes gene_type:complete
MLVKLFTTKGLESGMFNVPLADQSGFDVSQHNTDSTTAKVSSTDDPEILVDGTLHPLDVSNMPSYNSETQTARLTGFNLKDDGETYEGVWEINTIPENTPLEEE